MGIKLTVTGDLIRYGIATDRRGDRALDKAATEVKRNQYRTLLVNVKNWTGNLANSIKVDVRRKERGIGPTVEIAPYAGYIEDGNGEGDFLGYHYVSTSLRGVQQIFENLIRASLKK